jgi:nicotinamide mononucleotide transporter
MKKIMNYFGDWKTFEKVWLGISTLLILSLSLYWGDGLIGVTASLTGIWCVILVAKGKISNYYVGIVNILTYAWVAYSWKFYGEVMLNLMFFLPMQFVGILLWRKHMNSKVKEVKTKIMTQKQRFTWFVIAFVTILFYGQWLASLGGNMPYFDSVSTILSIIAMILMVMRYVEQWVLWIGVNVASICLWIYALSNGGTDISVLIMWVAYLVNSVYGLYNWNKLSQQT